ncbi:MAG: COG1361 S-layer family protein [Nanoarchaeota archaeon]|nr:COG1361 S-layer family protein [Nanoarchaeota archaeon]MBU1854411.1 COG1361 S-layer family protein [Nanoarchaeota archaeon]
MNKIITIAIIALMLIILSNVSIAADRSYLTATLMKYEPQPAEPGKYVKVYVKLENTGTKTAENVMLEVIPEFPFSLDPGKSNQKYIGLLGGSKFHVAEFNLRVDENAVEGTNKLKIKYSLDKEQTSWAEKELDVSIQTENSVLSITDIQTEPTELIPGSTGTIQIEIENMANAYLSDITVSLDLSSDNLPFAPMNSASEKNFYQLKTGAKEQVSFNIIAYPDAEAGIYKIPLTITYNDNVGNDYSKSDIVGVIVNSEPEIKVVVDSTTLLTGQSTGEVVLKIINKGLGDVKFLNLKLGETDNYEVLSSTNEEYIGNLDSDDFETVDFKLLLKSTEKVEIPLTLTYMDNNNKEYTQDLSLNLKIHTAEALGQKKGGSSWIIIIAVVVVAGFFYYRHRKKKKKMQQ